MTESKIKCISYIHNITQFKEEMQHIGDYAHARGIFALSAIPVGIEPTTTTETFASSLRATNIGYKFSVLLHMGIRVQ